MNKCKFYIFKGAKILAIQNRDNVAFYMQYKTSDFIFCIEAKGKLTEITNDTMQYVWRNYIDWVIAEENTLIDNLNDDVEELNDEEADEEDV